MTGAEPRSGSPADLAEAGLADAGLADAIESGLAGAGIPGLAAGVQRLMAAYRSGEPPAAPVMASRTDAAAYAAYRMPATAAATAAAVRELGLSLPGWSPATLLDFGAGTGAAAWAVAAAMPGLRSVTLLEQSPEAMSLGRAILGASGSEVLTTATWRSWRLSDRLPDQVSDGPADQVSDRLPDHVPGRLPGTVGGGLPAADLATVAYVLGELSADRQAALVELAKRSAPAVLFVEPGTPAGHRRILAARAQLLAAGYLVAAPCPHQLSCPLATDGEWCHFAARLHRSAVHRQVKGAELAYEDEKFSYVAMVRPEIAGAPHWPDGRVVRHPRQRKGLVILEVCASDGTSARELIGKSKGAAYRRARKTSWGDRFDSAE